MGWEAGGCTLPCTLGKASARVRVHAQTRVRETHSQIFFLHLRKRFQVFTRRGGPHKDSGGRIKLSPCDETRACEGRVLAARAGRPRRTIMQPGLFH